MWWLAPLLQRLCIAATFLLRKTGASNKGVTVQDSFSPNNNANYFSQRNAPLSSATAMFLFLDFCPPCGAALRIRTLLALGVVSTPPICDDRHLDKLRFSCFIKALLRYLSWFCQKLLQYLRPKIPNIYNIMNLLVHRKDWSLRSVMSWPMLPRYLLRLLKV